MTGDRRLTDEEKRAFLNHTFNALEVVTNLGGEPTLFEVALIEIAAKLDAQREWIIKIHKLLKEAEAK